MKKLFTLALVLLIAVGGYSQVKKASQKDALKQVAQEQISLGLEAFENVGSFPNMTRSDADLDPTTYDWQTNTAARNWTMTFPDGCVGFIYTVASDAGLSDRGTNIAIYNPNTDEWTTSGGKIEEEKTGFGCAARYGENGIVVVSRNAVTLKLGVFIIEDKDNLPASGSVKPIFELDDTYNAHFPCVMCTGPDHKHIHILATALDQTIDGVVNPYHYFRSMDGGVTWEQNMIIDYLHTGYGINYGSGQDAYFMENNGEDRLSIVVNTRRGDGVVLNSYDEGDTWERQEYFHHPGIDVVFPDDALACMYPRWTSALYDNEGHLYLAYEFGGQTGDATSTSYYPGVGGVAFWSDQMPYNGNGVAFGFDPNNPMPPVNGQPFIMDSAYLYQDIYASWWLFSDATHEMWNEYIGYLAPQDPTTGQPLVDPYEATTEEWLIEDRTLHGHYNGGVCEMPILMMTPDEQLMVAVWMAMDNHNTDGTDNFFFKLFARASYDKGNTWTDMIQLTTDFMYQWSECVYPQAAITGNTLVVACQMDAEVDSYTIGSGGDTDQFDAYYQGLTFDLTELFPGWDAVEEQVSNNTEMAIYPNPATEMVTVRLNQDEDIVICNLMGQVVSTVKGNAGVNNIDINSLTSGVYFISAGSATQKFIVK